MNLMMLFFLIVAVLLISVILVFALKVKSAGKIAGLILCALGASVILCGICFLPASMWSVIGIGLLGVGIILAIVGDVLLVKKN